MKRHINYYFLITAGLLVFFGILFLATLSATASLQVSNGTNYYLFHQLISVVIGLVLGFIAFKIPLHIIKKAALPLLIVNLILVGLVFLPFIGVRIWGASRWINLGKVTIQPSEFLKITAILYLSAWLSGKSAEHTKKDWMSFAKKSYHSLLHLFLPFMVLIGVIAIMLFFQKDVATLGITSFALLMVYFVAQTPVWHTILAILLGISSFAVLVKVEPYRVQRFLVFLHPERVDSLGIGFQLKQSLIAIGSGGIIGKGLGMSTQKFGFLPAAMSDSIFAILGEETGIIGCTILLALFVVFFWQMVIIAKNSQENFSKLTVVGLTAWLLCQTFMNIASSTGMFPLSGIPLPFFSYGGSHIIAELIAIGLVTNISKHG